MDTRSLLERSIVSAPLPPTSASSATAKNSLPLLPSSKTSFPDAVLLAGFTRRSVPPPTDLNFILAVDVPFVTPALIHFLIDRAESSKSIVTVPSAGHGLQPLCAVYRHEFAPLAEKALNENRYKIDVLFDPTTTRVIPERDLQDAGFPPSMFRNLNTPEDLSEKSHQ